jgi:hypothetical protein
MCLFLCHETILLGGNPPDRRMVLAVVADRGRRYHWPAPGLSSRQEIHERTWMMKGAVTGAAVATTATTNAHKRLRTLIALIEVFLCQSRMNEAIVTTTAVATSRAAQSQSPISAGSVEVWIVRRGASRFLGRVEVTADAPGNVFPHTVAQPCDKV